GSGPATSSTAPPAGEPRLASGAGRAPVPANPTSAACAEGFAGCEGNRQPRAEKALGALAATTPMAVTARTPLLAIRRPAVRDPGSGPAASAPETTLVDARPCWPRSLARSAFREAGPAHGAGPRGRRAGRSARSRVRRGTGQVARTFRSRPR